MSEQFEWFSTTSSLTRAKGLEIITNSKGDFSEVLEKLKSKKSLKTINMSFEH